jgi:PST family polysaccharide transporter
VLPIPREEPAESGGQVGAPPTDAVRGKAATGVRWGLFNQGVQQVTKIAVTVLLTKLIAPHEFGLMGLATLVINLGSLVTGIGFGAALVQHPNLERRHVSAAMTGSAVTGIVLTAATILVAPAVAGYFDQPELHAVIVAVSVVFLLKSIENVPNDVLRRHLLFREFVLSSTIAGVVSGVAATAFALAGFGVWALVGYALLDATIATALAWIFAMRAGVWRPSFSLDARSTRELLGYSAYVTGGHILGYIQVNGDNFTVGKVLGATELGYYGLAFRVMVYPIERVADVLGSVAFPVFAAVRSDVARLRRGFLEAVRYVAVVCFPVTVGVAVTAPVLVPVVFGPKWVPAVATLQILAANGPRFALIRLNGNLWQAVGKPQWSLWTSIFGLPFYIAGFLIGAQFGITGVAFGLTAAGLVGLPLTLWLAGRAIAAPVTAILASVGRIALATLVMAAAVLAADAVVPARAPDAARLVVMVLTGAAAYAACVWRLERDLVLRLVQDVARRGA